MRSYIHPTGDWTTGDSVLHLPCMCGLYFAFASKIENNVSYWCKYDTTIKLKLQSSTFCLQGLHHCRYLPNELRGGMMSFSLSLANAAIFIFLLQVSIWVLIWVNLHFCANVCTMLRSFLSSTGRPPSTLCKFNHPVSCVLWPVRSWGLHSYVEEVEKAH